MYTGTLLTTAIDRRLFSRFYSRGREDVSTQAITSFATGSLVTWPTRTTAAMRCPPILTFVPAARASLIESVRTTSSTRRRKSLCSCPSLWSTSSAMVTAGLHVLHVLHELTVQSLALHGGGARLRLLRRQESTFCAHKKTTSAE